MSEETTQLQLQMAWEVNLSGGRPLDVSLPDGYLLRTYRSGDEDGWFRVMALAGFEGWNREKLKPWLTKILPNGWFMVVHSATDTIVATAMAVHGPTNDFPFGGELGWVAADPEHAGRNLGIAVCGAVTQRLLDMGYSMIHLNTDDFRLPAVKIYLKLGYVPFLFAPDMADRWRVICRTLDWPCSPDTWKSL